MRVELTSKTGVIVMLEVPEDKLRECGIILYDGAHYLFAGTGGKFYQNLKFVECNPPLALERTATPPLSDRKFMGQPKRD